MAESFENTLVVLQVLTTVFLFAIGLAVLAVVVMYVIDKTQTRQAVRRNFPVIGRFRYLFEELGEFFRQYFFALDREEMEAVIEAAIADMNRAGVTGKDTTPYLLEKIAEKTAGRSLEANIALVKKNAQLAAEVAVACQSPA